MCLQHRCNRPTVHAGSVYNQQKAFFEASDDDRDPRDAFWEDLVREILPWMDTTNTPDREQEQHAPVRRTGGDHVVVTMDMNEDVRDHKAVTHLRNLGLTEIITHRHGIDGPRTCNRGSTPIDGIFVSPSVATYQWRMTTGACGSIWTQTMSLAPRLIFLHASSRCTSR
jgi:hypothetical protein